MGQVGYSRADHRQYLHGKHHFGYQWRLLQKKACGPAERLGEREPGQVADHHEHHKAGLTELFRRAHLKNVAEHEGIYDDVNDGGQEQPQPASDGGGELSEEILPGKVVKQPIVGHGREEPLAQKGEKHELFRNSWSGRYVPASIGFSDGVLEPHLTTNRRGKAKTKAREPLYLRGLKSELDFHASEP